MFQRHFNSFIPWYKIMKGKTLTFDFQVVTTMLNLEMRKIFLWDYHKTQCNLICLTEAKVKTFNQPSKKFFLVKLWCNVSKTLLTSSVRNFSKKDLNKTAFRIANFAKIAKVTRIFLAISIIGPVLKILFNKVFNSGIFPQLWSVGYISTVFKASDIGDPNNYRGITVCSCFGKFFTLIINNDRLTKYLNEHNIINTQQPNWLPKRLQDVWPRFCSEVSNDLYHR